MIELFYFGYKSNITFLEWKGEFIEYLLKLNGRPYDKGYITHEQIMNGDTLEFEMGNRPGPVWYNNM